MWEFFWGEGHVKTAVFGWKNHNFKGKIELFLGSLNFYELKIMLKQKFGFQIFQKYFLLIYEEVVHIAEFRKISDLLLKFTMNYH